MKSMDTASSFRLKTKKKKKKEIEGKAMMKHATNNGIAI